MSLLLMSVFQISAVAENNSDVIKDVRQLNSTTVEILYQDGKMLSIDFYSENIFRLFQDNTGGIIRDPEATPPAKILVNNPRKPLGGLNIDKKQDAFSVLTNAYA